MQNILKRHLSTETVNRDYSLNFFMLLTKEDTGLLLKKAQISGLCHRDDWMMNLLLWYKKYQSKWM